MRTRFLRFLSIVLALAVALVLTPATTATAATTEDLYGGEFVPLSPSRIVDTRTGLGSGGSGPVPGGSALTFQVAGRGGVPADGVQAVVLNVTIVGTGASGFAVVYPCCWNPPTASTHNFGPTDVVANQVVSAVGPKGRARVHISGGAHVVVDVAGYYTDYDSTIHGSRLRAMSPTRVLDTREGRGAPHAKVAKKGEIALQLAGTKAVPSSATAVVMNVTATNVSDPTFVTAYPDGRSRPNASNLNLRSGDTRPNLVTVKLGDGGRVRLYNHNGSVDLIADVVGYYVPGSDHSSSDGRVIAFHPARLLDTRNGNGPVGAQGTVSVDTRFLDPIVGEQPTGAFVNVTATAVTASTFATLYPKHLPVRPLASTLNARPGQTVPNLSLVSISSGGVSTGFTLYNHQGGAHLIADLVGLVL